MDNLQQLPWWVYPMLIIDLVLKGISLWKSARRDQRYWFLVLLIVNSAGIVPLIYLIYYGYIRKPDKKKKVK